MKETILALIHQGRLQISIESDWNPTEPGTHIWLILDHELIHSILLPEDDE